MSHRELSRLEIIRQRISKHLKQNVAADLLDMSVRQIQRLEKRYLQDGAFGLISKKRDKPSNHQISGKIKDEILSIVGSKYVDFGPTLAHEKLSENHNISISVTVA